MILTNLVSPKAVYQLQLLSINWLKGRTSAVDRLIIILLVRLWGYSDKPFYKPVKMIILMGGALSQVKMSFYARFSS